MTFWQLEAVPVSWEIGGPLLIVTVSGPYTFEEGRRAVYEALEDPEFRKGMSLLIDSRLSLANPPAEEIRARADWLASLPAKGLSYRMAIVVGSEPFRYGLSRMLSVYAENRGIEMRTFASVEDAGSWLAGPKHG